MRLIQMYPAASSPVLDSVVSSLDHDSRMHKREFGQVGVDEISGLPSLP